MQDFDEAHMWIDSFFLGTILNYKDKFHVKFRFLEHTQGTGNGTNYYTTDDKELRFKCLNHSLELDYKNYFTNFDINVNAGAKYDAYIQ